MKKGQKPSRHYRTSVKGRKFRVNPHIRKKTKRKAIGTYSPEFQPVLPHERVQIYKEVDPFGMMKPKIKAEEIRIREEKLRESKLDSWEKQMASLMKEHPNMDTGHTPTEQALIYATYNNDLTKRERAVPAKPLSEERKLKLERKAIAEQLEIARELGDKEAIRALSPLVSSRGRARR